MLKRAGNISNNNLFMRILIVFMMMIACSGSTMAQDKTHQEVASVVEKLRDAILAGDSASLVALTDPKLTYGHSGGKIESRNEFVSSLASGKADFKTLDLSDQDIRIAGKTAVVRHTIVADINDNGKDLSVKLGVLTVWVKNKGNWKLLARQAIKI